METAQELRAQPFGMGSILNAGWLFFPQPGFSEPPLLRPPHAMSGKDAGRGGRRSWRRRLPPSGHDGELPIAPPTPLSPLPSGPPLSALRPPLSALPSRPPASSTPLVGPNQVLPVSRLSQPGSFPPVGPEFLFPPPSPLVLPALFPLLRHSIGSWSPTPCPMRGRMGPGGWRGQEQSAVVITRKAGPQVRPLRASPAETEGQSPLGR